MSGWINSIALCPFSICGDDGQGGNDSARSSVKLNLSYVCNPVAAPLQVLTRIGFHAGATAFVRDALSTPSGLCLKPKTSPTVARLASRIFAECSLRAARLVSKGPIEFLAVPLLARLRACLFFVHSAGVIA